MVSDERLRGERMRVRDGLCLECFTENVGVKRPDVKYSIFFYQFSVDQKWFSVEQILWYQTPENMLNIL